MVEKKTMRGSSLRVFPWKHKINKPEKNAHSNYASRNPDFCQEFLKSVPERELLRACFGTPKKSWDSFKIVMVENLKRSHMSKKLATEESPGANPHPSYKKPSNTKRSRKVNNPKHLPQKSLDYKLAEKPWLCNNSACRKVQSNGEKFCKRGSCHICGKFDENKDSCKWLECKYQSGDGKRDNCGVSCHVECALEKQEVGVVYHGPSMHLDGDYRCSFCGTVSGIIEFWKMQLVIAQRSRHLNTLSYKINLSCRLLDGTLKFKELHEIVKNAKAKLESEIGPTDMDSASTLHGLVGRLSVAEDVRNLCSLAIEKADQMLVCSRDANPVTRARACNFVCEEVTLSSVQIAVFSDVVPNGLKGYKLWHHKTKEETRPEEPTFVIPTTLKTVTITGLQPSTEYTFCVAAYSEAGEWGHSETNCVTKGDDLVEICQTDTDLERESLSGKGLNNATGIGSSEHRVRGLGTLWRHGLDLNLAMVPDLNEEAVPPHDSSEDEEVSVLGEFHGNGESIGRCNGQRGIVFPLTTADLLRKTGNSKEDTHESNSTLSNMPEPLSPAREEDRNDGLVQSLEHCIKTIRRLEREGHISLDFRLKLLTWLCMRSTQYQRRLVHLFIDAFSEDPDRLARQLAHSFPDILPSKRPKNGC